MHETAPEGGKNVGPKDIAEFYALREQLKGKRSLIFEKLTASLPDGLWIGTTTLEFVNRLIDQGEAAAGKQFKRITTEEKASEEMPGISEFVAQMEELKIAWAPLVELSYTINPEINGQVNAIINAKFKEV